MNTTDPTRSDFAGPCSRCGGGVPNDTDRGVYPGALSRLDNHTYICSNCGRDEGLFQFMNKDQPLPPLDQTVKP